MSSDLSTQEGLLNDIRKRKQIENLYKKKMAKVDKTVPDLQSIQSKYLVSNTDLPLLKKQEGETEEEYDARLEQLKLNNSEVLEKYYNNNIELLRNNLKALIPNQQQINELVGVLSSEPKDIILINTYWKKFKKVLNDNFDSLSFTDFSLFLSQFLNILKDDDIEDKAKGFENIDISINDEVNKFVKAAQIMESKKNIPINIKVSNPLAYNRSLYPNLDEFGRAIDQNEAYRKREAEEKKQVLEKLMKRKEADDLSLKKPRGNVLIDDKKALLSEEFDSFIKAKRKEAIEKKKLEAKDLDEKSKSIDAKAPTITDIEPDEIIDEGTSSSSDAVKKIEEKEKGLVKKPELKTEPDMSSKDLAKKLEEADSGFVDEVSEMPKKDLITRDDVKRSLEYQTSSQGGNTKFNENNYKGKFTKKGKKLKENEAFVNEMNRILSNLSGAEAMRFKSSLEKSYLSEETINKYLVPYALEHRNKLIEEKGMSKDDAFDESGKIYGFGLSKSRKIVPIQFGRYILNKNKLDNQNLLQVLHENSLNQVKFFKSTYISDDMKDLIYYIIEKKNFSQKLYKLLDSSEQDLFNMLIDKSGLKKQLNINLGSSKYSDVKKIYKDLKEQYEILTSQIESGNDSPIVQKELNKTIKELKQIITHLSKVGELSKANATNMILSL
jgi:hypothetical protein